MLKRIKNLFYLLLFFVFVVLTTGFYFSEENIKKTNKMRSFYLTSDMYNKQSLPLLKNDTINIIEYSNDIEIYKKKKKNYTFWNLIGK